MNTKNKHTSIREGVVRLVCLRSIPLAFVLLFGCAKNGLRCDAHLTPINPPEPPAVPADAKPTERVSP